MMTEKACNGLFCKGKIWPIDRFQKDKDCNSGRKTYCKMCCANKENSSFVPGTCLSCGKQHECMFGSGVYCSRQCAIRGVKCDSSDVVIVEKSKNDEVKGKVCPRSECSFKGVVQPITSFYKRSRGDYRPSCKKCDMVDIRKHQVTLKGFIKNSLNCARRRAKQYGREFDLSYDEVKSVYDRQGGKCAFSGKLLTHQSDDTKKTSRNPFNMSLDRIDSSKGYTKENVQWICVWLQITKSDWNEKEFKSWLVETADHLR